MNIEVKKCADDNDIRGLRYIFVDCLDVDPTFEKYKEEYAYCKHIPGFLETYRELTPMKLDKHSWNENYWIKLKMDLMRNFSEKRFLHMVEVAKIVKEDKVKRLMKEREVANKPINKPAAPKMVVNAAQNSSNKNVMSQEKQNQSRDAAAREIELHNKRVEEEQMRKQKEREARRAELEKKNQVKSQQVVKADTESKKMMGIVLVAAIIAVIILLVFTLLMSNPEKRTLPSNNTKEVAAQ